MNSIIVTAIFFHQIPFSSHFQVLKSVNTVFINHVSHCLSTNTVFAKQQRSTLNCITTALAKVNSVPFVNINTAKQDLFALLWINQLSIVAQSSAAIRMTWPVHCAIPPPPNNNDIIQ